MKNSKFPGISVAILLLAGLIVAGACSTSPEQAAIDSFKNKPFIFQRGVNISHWLSQSNRRGQDRKNAFTQTDMDFIASQHFDHVRIPIDEEQMWDSLGNRHADAFQLLNQGIRWAAMNQLRVVVDLHILRSHYFNSAVKPLWTQTSAQEKFYGLWKDLSADLKKYPNGLVAYEPMNEPVADDPQIWNRVFARALAVVRENEPKRKVIIGSNRWQSVHTFHDLALPPGDANLILSFHFYMPMALTHHMASWVDLKDYKGPVYYPGLTVKGEDLKGLDPELVKRLKAEQKVFTRDSLEALMQEPISMAAKLGLPLYCGEWGCLKTAPDSARYAWYRDMRYSLEKNNIAWAIWDYKGGFGIILGDTSHTDSELIRILTGE